MRFAYPGIGFAFGLVVSVLSAKTFDDLQRIAPVGKDEPIPLADFIRPALMGWPEISPDGKRIAAIVKTPEDRQAVILYEVENRKLESFGGTERFNIHDKAWLDSGLLMTWAGSKVAKRYGLYGIRIREKRDAQIYRVAGSSYLTMIGVPGKDPRKPIMMIRGGYVQDEATIGLAVKIDAANEVTGIEDETSAWGNSGRFPYGVAANIDGSYPKPGGGIVSGYLSDTRGELAYSFTRNGKGTNLYRFDGKGWTQRPIDLDYLGISGVGANPDELIVTDTKETGAPRGLRWYDTIAGKSTDVLFQDDKYDVVDARLYRDHKSGVILGIQYERGGPHAVWFDPGFRRIQEIIEKSNPGKTVTIIDSDDDQKRLIISLRSDRQPSIYYTLDLETMSMGLIKSSAPWIDPDRMQPMQIMAYKARDGKRIEAYLTLPAGASKAKPVPLIVYPHGGPWARNVWGFDGEVQLLASRGFAVFQPNYRGSDGYQWQFPETDLFDFRKMHDDVTDGTRALIKSGLIDPKRIAIMGGSFGGYLSLCGVAFEPDLYACAVTMAGVFDWEQFIKTLSYNDDLGARSGWLRRKLGDPKVEKEKYNSISPLRHLSGVKVPVFVTHGKDDHTVPVSESKALIAGLEKNNIAYEKYFMPDEAHGVWFFEHRMEYHTRILKFLETHLRPKQ